MVADDTAVVGLEYPKRELMGIFRAVRVRWSKVDAVNVLSWA